MRTIEHSYTYRCLHTFLDEIEKVRERMIGDREDIFVEVIPLIGKSEYILTVKISR